MGVAIAGCTLASSMGHKAASPTGEADAVSHLIGVREVDDELQLAEA
eukprot:COSAG02_NODE_534_length_20663_cov_20.040945_12_plen_47_part_00